MSGDILGAEAQTVIALIQEPYVGKGGVPLGFPRGLNCYYGGKKARAAIVTKGIDLLLCLSFSGDDVVTCQTRMGMRDLYLVSTYLGINSGIPDELTRLLDSGLTEKAVRFCRFAGFVILHQKDSSGSLHHEEELEAEQETTDEWRRTRVRERGQVPRDQVKPQTELAGTYPG